ncbi:MAG TPA: hypothetical protein VNZ05_10050 [Solirubrobacteraceae bacterium]|nr:hypothetical protein [Solirubrobacteraceae bacterium]
MTTDRRIFRLGGIALACFALLAATPLAAHAGPLLSGYGGPGQGNQAILGSTLLGGPGGGSGSGGANEGVAAASATGGLAEGTSSSGKSGASGRHRGSSSVTGLHGAALRAGALGGLHGRPAPAGTTGFYPTVEPAAASTPALGLSSTDILYIVLAAAALIGTGVLTRRMLRPGPAKGHS